RPAAERAAARGAVVRAADPPITLPYGLVYSPGRLSPAGRAFLEVLPPEPRFPPRRGTLRRRGTAAPGGARRLPSGGWAGRWRAGRLPGALGRPAPAVGRWPQPRSSPGARWPAGGRTPRRRSAPSRPGLRAAAGGRWF